MTDKEAVEWLISRKEHYEMDDNCQELAEAIQIGINAIEQKLCEDAVSKQAVAEVLFKYAHDPVGKRFAEFLVSQINDLPPVSSSEKTGHWIADVDKWGDIVTTVNGYKCSECEMFNAFNDKYCPNCGAKMDEPQEGGDQE